MTAVVLAHVAELQLDPDADNGAPGAAVTVALCGHWEHDGACRWPHLTQTEQLGDGRLALRTRVLSSTEEADGVRRAMVAALRNGGLDGPAGRSTWQVLTEAPGDVTVDDETWAQRQSPL